MLDRLVTLIGGGGFLGRYVAQELLGRGARVRIAERHPDDAFFLKPLGGLGQTQFVSADITRPGSLQAAVRGADMVINFVGLLKGDFQAVHVRGAGNAAQAAADAGVADFIQISSIGADKDASSHYLKSKFGGEAAVRAAMPGAIVFRPSIIFGPEDGFINRFATMARMLPLALPVVRPQAKFQPVYVADVAEAVAQAAMAPDAHRGETYELGGPEVMTMADVNRFVLDAIGKPGKTLVPIPDAMARTMAKFGWLPGAPMTWDQWCSLQTDNVVPHGAQGFGAFGIEPRPIAAVADRWLVRYRSQGRFANRVRA